MSTSDAVRAALEEAGFSFGQMLLGRFEIRELLGKGSFPTKIASSVLAQLRRRPELLFENRRFANPIKFFTKLFYSFGAIAALDEFGSCQGIGLSEHFDLKFD